MWLQIVLAFILVALAVRLSSAKKPQGIPPGLWGWPIIGVLPSQVKPLADQVRELRKTYGDIISWRMGNRLFIFLCNSNLIKTAFAKPEAADRPDFYSFNSYTEFTYSGIGNASGRPWINNRRFALQHLKDLGMGKTFLGEAIRNEAEFLVRDFRNHLNRPVSLPWSINVAMMNVIWMMVAGTRYDIDDKKLTRLHLLWHDSLEELDGRVVWLDLFPWLTSILPFKVRTWLGFNKIYDDIKEIRTSLLEDVVDEHVKNLDPSNPKDYIDAYLLEMEKLKNDPTSTFTMKDLKHGIIDFFGDGSATVSLTTRWAILFLAKYPEVQEKAQKQIDSVVPKDRLPVLEDKEGLPYIEAFINEVMRVSSIVPLGVMHSNSEEIELGGYRIPKNSCITSHVEICHKDPNLWEKPDEFYPDHFLDKNGKFMMKKEGFYPFAIGRRRCVGEALARMELYFFLTSLIQNFNFSAPEGEKLSVERTGAERIMSMPKDFKILITERK